MRLSSPLQTVTIFSSLPKTLVSFDGQPQSQYLQLSKPKRCLLIVTMRDRSKNPRPLQKGRNLSIEAIQTIQALKRAKKNEGSREQVFDSKFRRLLKLDMMAVLKDLLRQNECLLALKVCTLRSLFHFVFVFNLCFHEFILKIDLGTLSFEHSFPLFLC